jgi:hypothetical protein
MRKQALTIGASILFFYEALGRVFTAQKANKKIDTADSVLKRPNNICRVKPYIKTSG